MRIAALIPARSGSKRIPRKNVTLCAGKPLIAWTVESALEAGSIANTYVSTDSPEIAEIAKAFGAEVPFIRPTELSEDSTPMIPVMQHFLEWAKASGHNFDCVAILQPTSPLRIAQDIDGASQLMTSADTETVVSVVEMRHTQHPSVLHRLENGHLKPYGPGMGKSEAENSPCFARNGPAVLINRCGVYERGNKFGETIGGYVMPAERSIDVDEPWELAIAECLLTRRMEMESS